MKQKSVHHSQEQPGTVEFERSLFHPLQVDEEMLKWMAAERQKINAALPDVKPVITTLKGLADREFNQLISGYGLPDVEPVVLEDAGLRMFRTLRENQPRWPVYVLSDKELLTKVRDGHELGIEGAASDIDLETSVYDAGRNKVHLLWGVLGQIAGAKKPILGFIRGEDPNGLLYVIEPKTTKLERYMLGLKMENSFDEDEKLQATEGRKLAELALRDARHNIRPRGACDPGNICVRSDGKLFYGDIFFQPTNTPQESMSFMLREHLQSTFHILDDLNLVTPCLANAFMDTINDAGMLDYIVFSQLRDNLATHHRYRRIPRPFRDYIEKTIGKELPPMM